MMHFVFKLLLLSLVCLVTLETSAQGPIKLQFDFEHSVESKNFKFENEGFHFVDGRAGSGLKLGPDDGYTHLRLDAISLDQTRDFSIQFWIKTSSIHPMVFLSQKSFNNKGITSQKNAGWALYSSGGTLAWSIGSGERRLNYERDNGEKRPINDGRWHHVALTHDRERSEMRLYQDGQNVAIYKVNFEFGNSEPIAIGSAKNPLDYDVQFVPEIEQGREQLQQYVDAFNGLGAEPLQNQELIDLIVDPRELFHSKLQKSADQDHVDEHDLTNMLEARKRLDSNPYTTYQNKALTNLKPVSKIYELVDGRVEVNIQAARTFTQSERLHPADFIIDELSIAEETLSARDILDGFEYYGQAKRDETAIRLMEISVGVWNIWHGGIHWTEEKDGWDSRLRIVEMIEDSNIDIVLMQETYSSGDFIAAELGYYFATTSDWDYRDQGSNISVLSRYPIEEIEVSLETEFNNIAVKVALSETQEIWAMSNWYGMNQFPAVFEYHQSKFAHSDSVPVLFGGDFNAVPHLDGGDSPASIKLAEAGFVDAYRESFPNVENNPGFTHRNGVRIDQLYYKGRGLKNTRTEVLSSWPSGFPSDHYLIVSQFDLGY